MRGGLNGFDRFDNIPELEVFFLLLLLSSLPLLAILKSSKHCPILSTFINVLVVPLVTLHWQGMGYVDSGLGGLVEPRTVVIAGHKSTTNGSTVGDGVLAHPGVQ